MEKKINININPETAKGVFSNVMLVTHSASEFILDFAQSMPGLPATQVVSRIILTPDHAKRLLNALNDNVKKYEHLFGEIKFHNGTYTVPGGSAQA